MKLDAGVEGLIHISELAHHRVFAVKNIVNEGDEVTVKVVSVDRGNQRIGLSLKAMQEASEENQGEKPEEGGSESREFAAKRKTGGSGSGKDRPSDGDEFGLHW